MVIKRADACGAEIPKRRVAGAEVLIEHDTPRVMANVGLEYGMLRAVNPRPILMSAPGFGAEVSWRDDGAWRSG